MAGPTTAQRGAPGRTDTSARPPHIGPEGPRIGRRLLLVLIGVAAALLTAFVVWALYGSSWFRVAEVRTSGVEVLSREQVEAAAATPLGAPLVSVDTDAMERRLRQKLPRIDTVDVVRSWPDGIGLEVTERKPVLLVEKGGKFVEVDAEGVRFATVDKAPKGVPCWNWSPNRPRACAGSARTAWCGKPSGSPATSPRPWRPTRKPSGSSRTTPSPCGSPATAW